LLDWRITDESLFDGVAVALVSNTFALADTPVTPAEAAKIKAALEVLGCTGGKMEKN
jgi:hypothetical protein